MIDEDLDSFLEDHGVPCVCGATTFLGIKDEPDEDLSGGGISAQSTMTTLLVKTSVVIAANIKHGTSVQVNGVAYTARNPSRLDDGLFSSIPLSKVSS